ncbi:MAG: sulfurtransferase [Nitriliruptorales bacterium]|nr:sulfurtransferase [Nitriliruptorales bacterium]
MTVLHPTDRDTSRTIASEDLRILMQTGVEAAVLDVREQRWSDAGHILGSTNVPRRALEWHMKRLVPLRSTPVILYDDDLSIAPRAADDLRAVGYDDVRVLHGGLAAWSDTGLAVDRGHSVPSKHFGELVQHADRVPSVSPQELHSWLAEGRKVVLCDVRTAEEHARETLPGSVNVPGFELPIRLEDPEDDATVVVHCSGRTRSIIGTATLQRSGIRNAVGLENGTMGWLLAGYDVEHGACRDGTATVPVSGDGDTLRRRWRAEAESVGVRYLAPRDADRVLQASRQLGSTAYLFDVRTHAEHLEAHAAGAQWAPGGQLVQLTDTYVAVQGAVIVLMCDGSARSSIAAYWLRRMGFGAVLVVAGGVHRWQDEGLPTESGEHPEVLGLATAQRSVKPVSAEALGEALRSPSSPPVVHVDTSAGYERGHVPGASWVSPTRLEARLEEIGAARSTPTVLTCRDGVLSRITAWKAQRAGWRDVAVLDGGLDVWERDGRPVDRTPVPDHTDPDDRFIHPVYRGPEAMRDYLDWEVALGG